MKTKLLAFILAFSWIYTPVARSALISPYINFEINKIVVGGDDGEFNFKIAGYQSGSRHFYEFLSVQTTDGFGTNYISSFTGQGDTFYITEDSVPGWNIENINCNSNNPSITFTPVQNGMKIKTYPYSYVSCNFTNVKKASKTPVLILPGVLGTNILKDNQKLWLDLGHNFTDYDDQFMDPLVFNSNLTPSDTSLILGEVIRIATASPETLVQYNYTHGLIQEFTSLGYTEGADLFTFPYDWRYGASGKYADGSTNVDKLGEKIANILTATQANKVDIIAHSTGGLLVKKYVMDNPTSHNINKAVFVGVPNLGAPKAIKVLLKGDGFGIPWLADGEMQKISQNLPVVYDLAPSRKYYLEQTSPVKVLKGGLLVDSVTNLDFFQTVEYLKNQKHLNAQAIDNATNLHSNEFDTFDLRTAGVDLYSIVGCKSGTYSQILDFQNNDNTSIRYDDAETISGDGTVPFESANSLVTNDSNKFYTIKPDHGKMLSAKGIREKIVNILAGSNLEVGNNIISRQELLAEPKKCKLKGRIITIKSPVEIEIIDQGGNRLGFASDGSLQNDIPGADFSISGEHKFVYLPDDEALVYTIGIKGTGNGTFTLKNSKVEDDKIIQTQVFSNVPVTPDLLGSVEENNQQIRLNLDTNGDHITDQVILPTSILNSSESQDLIPPVSTSTIAGLIGDAGFYRSNATITLSSLDPITLGQEMPTSGILKTQYNLNQQGWVDYHSPIVVANEGNYTLEFFSTDKAGNNEAVQTLHFVIDKTAPELGIKFNPQTKDLSFVGKDNLTTTSQLTLLDLDDNITVKDQAGNITELKLKEKGRKKTLKAEIKALSYNGVNQDINPNSLKVNWQTDKQGQLKELHQAMRSKKDYNVKAEYNSKTNKTKLEGKDALGRINKTLAGLVLLNTFTDKGDLKWEY
jgi:pimeloyl-ACP methyl ester carboxylesterase